MQALAAVLGGTQSLHTNSMDETLALPSEKAAEIALRTQQIIAFESGVVNSVDPLGGSWLIEKMTDELEEKAMRHFDKIDSIGGVIEGIELGYFQKEIADSSIEYQRKVESKQRIIVGVNEFYKEDEEIDIPILKIREEVESEQVSNIQDIRKKRNNKIVAEKLKDITEAASGQKINLIPLIISAAKNNATLGEIVDSMKKVYGEWSESVTL